MRSCPHRSKTLYRAHDQCFDKRLLPGSKLSVTLTSPHKRNIYVQNVCSALKVNGDFIAGSLYFMFCLI